MLLDKEYDKKATVSQKLQKTSVISLNNASKPPSAHVRRTGSMRENYRCALNRSFKFML